jgi:preprotein translocase subunit YajC
MNPSFLLSLDSSAAPSAIGQFLPPLVIVGVVFYFFVYQPGKKEEGQRRELIASLQRGDKVVTTSGIHGTMHEAKAETIVLEISPGAFLTVDRDQVKAKITEKPAEPAKKG